MFSLTKCEQLPQKLSDFVSTSLQIDINIKNILYVDNVTEHTILPLKQVHVSQVNLLHYAVVETLMETYSLKQKSCESAYSFLLTQLLNISDHIHTE